MAKKKSVKKKVVKKKTSKKKSTVKRKSVAKKKVTAKRQPDAIKAAVKKKSTKAATVKKRAAKKTVKKKTASSQQNAKRLADALEAVEAAAGRTPTEVVPNEFPWYACPVDAKHVFPDGRPKSMMTDREAVRAVVERLKGTLDGFRVAEGYHECPAVLLVPEIDQYRFFQANDELTRWLQEKGDEHSLQLTGMYFAKYYYQPSEKLSNEQVKRLRIEARETFGANNPITISPHRLTVRYS